MAKTSDSNIVANSICCTPNAIWISQSDFSPDALQRVYPNLRL